MKISEAMTRDVIIINPEASLREACEKMRDEDIGFLPVCDGDRIQGVITDRDVAINAIASGYDPYKSGGIKEVMKKEVVYIYEDQEILEAARLMEVKQLRRLMVLNRDKKLVGILSLGDVSVQSRDHQLAGEVLKQVSSPAEQHPIN